MIESGDGWKFAAHLADRGFFADQLVEHVVTGHRAVRRVFSDKFSRDAAAVEAVRAQCSLAAPMQHPAIPAVYMVEEVQRQLCVYFEYVQEPYLDAEVARVPFAGPGVWSRRGLLLVRAFARMQQLGIGTDRVRLDNIAMHGPMVRFATRWPLANLSELEAAQSLFLQRLVQSPYGGVYAVNGAYPERACLARLKDLLYHLATGKTDRTVGEAIEAAKSSGNTLAPLGVDSGIERILRGLHDPKGPDAITTLEVLEAALSEMAGGRRRSGGPSRASEPQPALADAPPVAAAPGPRRPAPLPELKPRPGDAPRREEKDAPHSSSRPSSNSIEAIAADAEEDRAYLYPNRNKTPAAATPTAKAAAPSSGGLSALTSSASAKPASASGGGTGRMIGIGLAAVVGIAVVVGAAFFLLGGRGKNLPPTASIAPVNTQVQMYQTIMLDGSGSTDPEGAPLKYSWRVLDLDRTNYKFSRNADGTARTTDLQFFQTGTFRVQLEVFDGKFLSAPPAELTFTVSPRG
jgi:hypothetical protein